MDWLERQAGVLRMANKQLFFVGGAPRSGTTWVQHLLDAHPDVSCRGEAHFLNHLVEPMGALMARRRQALHAKNVELDGGTNYPLPDAEDFEFLVGSAILLALEQQSAGRDCRAIGEKTPENVFYFPNLKRLFPSAKFIGVVRDPRDSLTSAWHFFRRKGVVDDETSAKFELIRSAIPSLTRGTRMMLDFPKRFPGDCIIVTYEALLNATRAEAARLFRFLGVADPPGIVDRCAERTAFEVMSGGRRAGVAKDGAFFREGVAGGWKETLTPEMNDFLLRELGWMFEHFGWAA